MRVVLQRVRTASVTVDGEVTGSIGLGLCLLVGIAPEDTDGTLQQMAERVTHLRIFPDDRGRFHHSLLDVGGSALLVPQFTLFADCSKGRRPEFFGAAPPPVAAPLFERFAEAMRARLDGRVGCGVFGAHMLVALENDGPVTLTLEI